jgi:tetratricopeptide (TPR) repeat protein
MRADLQKTKRLLENATSARKKGDALDLAGFKDDARQAYQSGADDLVATLAELDPDRRQLLEAEPPLADDQTKALNELIEAFGSLGGMQQRLGSLKDAARSYSEGARLEDKFNLQSTYNRLNAVKYALLTGEKTLQDLESRIDELASHIDASLRADKVLSDKGWAWADLGDCLALLGRQEEARRAYSTFIAKAEIKSPQRTLAVLRQIASSLRASGDPDAERLQSAVTVLESGLAAR